MQKANESNFKQVIVDWVGSEAESGREGFREEIEKALEEFPYWREELDEELSTKDFADWFVFTRKMANGKTPSRLFTEKHGIGPELEGKIRQLEGAKYGVFTVLHVEGDEMEVRNREGETFQAVRLWEKAGLYKEGMTVRGRLHPWGDKYAFTGITTCSVRDGGLARRMGLITPGMVDEMMGALEEGYVKDAETLLLYPGSRITAVLNKYPAQWVNGTCKALGLDRRAKKAEKAKMVAAHMASEGNLKRVVGSLPDESRSALEFVLDSGGWVKYGQLARRYDDEMSFWWDEHPPESVVGILRLHCLLFVGRMPVSSRLHRVAMVPPEIRENLRSVLQAGKT